MDRFIDAIGREANRTVTENLQLAYRSVGVSSVLDFFGTAGALRSRSEQEIERKMARAFEEDPLLTVKLLFYLGDIRGGLGERRTFQIALRWLAAKYPGWVKANLGNVAYFNRWDSLFVLKDTPCEETMLHAVQSQLEADRALCAENAPHVSLLAKWMPSTNASSRAARRLGLWFAKAFGWTEKDYRKTLSALRGSLDVVERKMSSNVWENINYGSVPSVAMTHYRGAFKKRDGERFAQYLRDVSAGREKIHAAALFPYNIVEKILYQEGDEDEVLEAQWKALPDYLNGASHSIMVMADVSGSMSGRPMATAIGLGVYFAERNAGPYRNLFMTFSSNPSFVKLDGDTLREKVNNMIGADWEQNTNLAAAFRKILSVAVEHSVPAEEMPKALLVISDMEIDAAVGTQGQTADFLLVMETEFAQAGYALPHLIFWNVDSRHDTFLVEGNRKGVQLVSGQSPSVFRGLVDSMTKTPYETMLLTLLDERYDRVVPPEPAPASHESCQDGH